MIEKLLTLHGHPSSWTVNGSYVFGEGGEQVLYSLSNLDSDHEFMTFVLAAIQEKAERDFHE